MADLFDSLYPPNVRTSDPITSHTAAAKSEPKRGTHASQCLAMFRAYPNGLTYAEVERYTMLRGAWKRCSDLKNLKLIVGTKQVRDGSEVYRAAE